MRHGLGRKPSPPDSRDYKLSSYHADVWPDFARDCAFYGTGPVLDQGSTPHCCGFAGAHWSNAEPVINDWDEADAHALYWECKAIDGDDEDGSYIRTVAKALKERGRLDKYAFGSLLDGRRFLLQQGPVIFGLDWREAMFSPGPEGVIRAEGDVCGGHAILAVGADPGYCLLQNSWGKDWGRGGTCRISWDDLERVFGEYGEAMAAVELPLDHEPEPVSFWTRLWRWLCQLLKS